VARLAALALALALLVPWALVHAHPLPRPLLARLEQRHGLPEGLLGAVVSIEGGWRRLVIRWNRTSCDVGPAQVNVPGCSPLGVLWVLHPRANLAAAARILALSARTCARQPRRIGCAVCPWGRYNPASPGWCARLADAWRSPDA
jgi:hypothetical protein